jgi:hypothetical protein
MWLGWRFCGSKYFLSNSYAKKKRNKETKKTKTFLEKKICTDPFSKQTLIAISSC